MDEQTTHTTHVERMRPVHLPAVVAILQRMRHAGDPYPPRVDVGVDTPGLTAWLLEDAEADRFVALHQGEVVGHVQAAHPHDYLAAHRPVRGGSAHLELGKLVVTPEYRGRGVASLLLQRARSLAAEHDARLVLAVVEGNITAIRFYLREGFELVDVFAGRHGVNQVFADVTGSPAAR